MEIKMLLFVLSFVDFSVKTIALKSNREEMGTVAHSYITNDFGGWSKRIVNCSPTSVIQWASVSKLNKRRKNLKELGM